MTVREMSKKRASIQALQEARAYERDFEERGLENVKGPGSALQLRARET
jgi:hypothetical protein